MDEIRNVIFDIGNVLMGYRWRQMLMDYGLTEAEADRVGREMFDDPQQLWHQYDLGNYSVEGIIHAFASEWPEDSEVISWFIRHGEYMTVPKPKVWEKAHELKEKGFRLYLLSNYPEDLFHKHMEYCDLMQDLDGMVISFTHHEAKPDRAIYERLCRTYDLVPGESIFFDDREENVHGAENCGIHARLVRSQTGLLDDLDSLLQGKPFRQERGEEASDAGLAENRKNMRVAVYCGANAGDNPDYLAAAERLGDWIGSHGDTLVYGAGALGMMGTIAAHVQAGGGKIIGVIPQFMVDNGWQKDGIDEMIVTDTMSSRKMRMMELADVCVAMPGGPGTVDEIAEQISLSALHLHDRECILCSVDGYYEPLRQMYEKMVLEGFAPEEKLEHTHFAGSTEEMLDLLESIQRAE